ncbi:FecR family protein [Arenibacter latericius]|uniref:FecR family protein n=1 Tax=Arenibacter latericius TaxID=86104 RepID=UPI0004066F6D|nr:FecR domain-containing protein [Arenibacter latericius]
MKVEEFLTNKHFIVWMLTQDPAGTSYWEEYLNQNPGDKANFIQAKTQFQKAYFKEERLTENEKDALYQKLIRRKATEVKGNRKIFRSYTKYAIAATLALLISIGLYYYRYNASKLPSEILVEYNPIQENVILISGDNHYLFESNTALKINESGIVDENGDSLKTVINDYNTLIVPYGKRSELVLSDGSKLWVNSGSKLKFPSKFSDRERRVYLEGEIYIEVAKNSSRPFIVETPKVKVDVLGTMFNVNAYSDSFVSEDRVVVVEGSVGVKTTSGDRTKLVANESATFTEAELIKERVDVDRFTSWKNGYLLFNDTPMEKVLLELSRYYNITFSEESQNISEQTCTGKIYLSDDVSDVLKTLSILIDGSFTIKQK